MANDDGSVEARLRDWFLKQDFAPGTLDHLQFSAVKFPHTFISMTARSGSKGRIGFRQFEELNTGRAAEREG